MRKTQKHLLIRRVIEGSPIRTQKELLDRLRHYNVAVTQAVISRNIRGLEIMKAPGENGISRSVLFRGKSTPNTKTEEGDQLIQMIEDIVLKVERVHFLTIVDTLSDNAHLFASVLDEIRPPSIISTIAGFDTIIITSESERDAKQVEEFLHHPTEVPLF